MTSNLRHRKRWPLGFYRVTGESMMPTLRPGQLLLGARWHRPRPGDIAVIWLDQPYIKRLIRREPDGWWVEGDNAAVSHDSRSFGAVRPDLIEAVIVWSRKY